MSACELAAPRLADAQLLMQAAMRRIGGIALLLLVLSCASAVLQAWQ